MIATPQSPITVTVVLPFYSTFTSVFVRRILMFFNYSLMKIEFGLVEFDVKAGVAGKPCASAVDTVVHLEVI